MNLVSKCPLFFMPDMCSFLDSGLWHCGNVSILKARLKIVQAFGRSVGNFLIHVKLLVKATSFIRHAKCALTCAVLSDLLQSFICLYFHAGLTSFTQLTHNGLRTWHQFHPAALLLLPMTTTEVSTTYYKSIQLHHMLCLPLILLLMIHFNFNHIFLLTVCCKCKCFRAHRIVFQQQFMWQFGL